ncbi:pyridine nucleotide-disulfide oxidoreductase [Pseudonocardia sulfidoxydans NBRC 16205]|uniref:Pyridine nucleotide-disulfide oxidoreductase n=1 Tax=Pseudonocardia sulfidoxydans NBRC 16205 TaxID=1223511 RepID=A0A511DRJ1_9PSEU|nr:FAD-dependent oxidoreductase [Pseudonocardia sulfidoxydans]GEL26927.1 pyridine nucleotide-disulfide oxidoreductase [Pseudonocardia sulfidoxydans NBRC 16205]
MTPSRCVIVGGGTAAAAAAASLRSAGFDGSLTLVSSADAPPYERPPLSKGFLTGACSAEDLQLRPSSWYDDNDVELRLGTTAEALDVDEHTLTLGDGERIRYDRVLLATGGTPRRLPDVESDRVLYLRDIGDAEALAKRLVPGEPLVVLGGGFIGCEVAASARALGVDVTVLEMAEQPLQRVVGAEVGRVVADIHREHGVTLRTGERVETVRADVDGVRVTTDRGPLECATLVVAVGLRPSTELAVDSGLAVDGATGGIVVDRFCRTTAPDVYAAGDVAAHDHPRYGRLIRVEHHDNAVRQGAAAGRAMLGERKAYTDPHWFWSDQYTHSIQQVGRADGCDETVVRGSLADRDFSMISLSAGRVCAVFALDRGVDILGGRRLIDSGVTVTAEQLRDESVSLKKLATAGRSDR